MSDTPSMDSKVPPPVETNAEPSEPVKQQEPSPLKQALPQPPEPFETTTTSPKKDEFQSPKSDATFQARKMAEMPRELGRKISFLQPEKILTPKDTASKPVPQKTHLPQTHTPITPQHYLKLSQDPFFRQPNLRDSPLYRTILQRALSQTQGGEGRSALTTTQLALLIRMRHQAQDRPNLGQVIRFEMEQIRPSTERTRRRGESKKTGDSSSGSRSSAKTSSSLAERLKPIEGTSLFESVLKDAQAGQEVVSKLPEGRSAQFMEKSEGGWKTFFANVLGRGSVEQEAARESSSLQSALYRGLYKAAADQKGQTLVSDFRFANGGRLASEKFARLLVENPHLLSELQKMDPGDKLPKELFEKMGEKLNYKKLTHQVEVAKRVTGEAQLSQLKSLMNASAMARLESSLIEERGHKQKISPFWEEEKKKDAQNWWGGDPRWEKEKRIGKLRPWIFFGYATGAIILVLGSYLLLRALGIV